MGTRTLLIATFCLFLMACSEGPSRSEPNNSQPAKDTSTKTENPNRERPDQYIYDFLKMVIAEQGLDLGNGLSIQPEQNCSSTDEDKKFLRSFLIKQDKVKKDTTDWLTISTNSIPRCLTQSDIDTMLAQKAHLTNFEWDNQRLGFDLSNEKNWYCFSIPLFSKDRKQAIIKIESLCPGLCGTGSTLLFTKKDNKWTSQSIGDWWH